jgi:hypothetical protein
MAKSKKIKIANSEIEFIYGVESGNPLEITCLMHNILVDNDLIHFDGKRWLYFDENLQLIKQRVPERVVAKRTFKIWAVVEEHIVYEDGSDEYKDVEDVIVSAGEFDTLNEANLRIDLIYETFSGDFTEDEE